MLRLLGKTLRTSPSTRTCATLTRNTKDIRPEEYDAVIVGGGHNGLVTAAYLGKAGKKVCVLERRHLLGGAAVTEELVPGFKFSRASYVCSLLRPMVFDDLELKKHGLEIYLRNPNSYTPLLGATGGPGSSLTLSLSHQDTADSIAQFSKKDAVNYFEYEKFLGSMVDALTPILDLSPPVISSWKGKSLGEKIQMIIENRKLIQAGIQMGSKSGDFYDVVTAPAERLLDQWLESEPLKATLATDSVIGAMTSPKLAGSGYVLLHHVMGGIEIEGIRGAWGYVKGGMGGISDAIARAAHAAGAEMYTNALISEIVVDGSGAARGVVLEDGTEIKSKVVLSNATPKVTYLDLMKKGVLPEDFEHEISLIDYTSPVTKINIATSRLPNFLADLVTDGKPGPQHRGTIHLNCEHSKLIHDGYIDAVNGQYSKRPVIEMTIPSSIDKTVSPEGAHVIQLFTQYTPYTLAGGRSWDEATKQEYANTVFDIIEEYAPGFKDSIIGVDILTPPDLEEVFGLTGGNIFHGQMSLDKLFFGRPLSKYCDFRTPIKGLYMCGSSCHPGGGVMGSVGRLAAQAVLQDKAC